MEIQHIQATAIIKELQTEGHSPLLIVGNDFKMYVAKNDKGKQPPFSLINEILSAVFLKIWKLQPPPFKLVVDSSYKRNKPPLSMAAAKTSFGVKNPYLFLGLLFKIFSASLTA